MKRIEKKEKIKSSSSPLFPKIKLKSSNELSEFAESIINTVREPLLVLDKELRVIKASHSFYNVFKVTSNETIGTLIYDLGNHQWDIPKLRELLETILPEKTSFENYEVKHDFSSIGKRIMLLNARQIERGFGKENIILLAIEDITDRKLVEESDSETSRVTNEYLDILFNHAYAPIIVWDASWVIMHINNAFEKLSGYVSIEVIDKKIDILFPKEKVDLTLDLIKNTLQNDERPELIEVEILTKDNVLKTVLWNPANIFDKEGKHIVATIAQDITNRKHDDGLLRESEERYRSFFENSMDAIMLTIPDGQILSANPAACKIFGYSEEELIKLGQSGVVDNMDPQLNILLSERKLNGYAHGELTMIRKDGTHFPVEISSAVFKTREGHERTSMIVRDITGRKQAEEALVESEKRFRSIFENSSVGMLILGTDGKIQLSNSAIQNMLGYNDDEFRSMFFVDFTHPDDIEKSLKKQSSIYSGKWLDEKTIEKRYIAKDGHIVWANISVAVVYDNSHKPQYHIAIIEDVTERKRVEESLKESEELFRHSFDFAAAGICIVGTDGKFLRINNAFKKMIGYDEDELKNFTFTDITYPDDISIGSSQFKKMVDGEIDSTSFEKRYIRKDKQIIWAYVSTSLVRNVNQKSQFFITQIIDITEQKRAEEEIIMLAHSLRSINECVSITDMEDKIIFVNESFLKTYGYNENELVGKNMSIVRSSKNPPELVNKILPSTIFGGWQGELWNKRKNGSEFLINLSTTVINDNNSKPLGLIGVATDITEKKKMETNLSSATEIARLGYWEYDVDSDQFTFNDQYYRLIHGSSAQKQGGNIMSAEEFARRLVYPDDASLVAYALQAAVSSPDPNYLGKGEARVFRDDGEIANVSVQFKALKDSSGRTYKIYGINQDVTENKRVEKELIEAKERAEQSDKLKTEFLSQMSHEIRTPINIMLGNVDYLNESFSETMDPEIRDCFESINLASKRIIRTVDLILNASELQTSGYKPQFVKIDLNSDILQKLYQDHLLSAKQKGLEIIYSCKEKNTIVIADQYSITQIFSNLIDNAIKFTIKGKVEILLEKNKTGNIVVEVKDTGIGLSTEFLPKMFEPFVQEDQGFIRSFDGNGLGLTLVKKYCEVNNVILEVESKKNSGSTFRVIFGS
ncbi:MAG: sensor histidine kinase [Melioribacteraceae bacterium]